jgi:NADH-ubiquinone oxidoreductase chain 5
MILIGSLSLMALPFLTGFYSKDLILEVAFGQYLFTGNVAYWLGTISAVFTAFYSLRLLALTFLTYPNGPKINYLGTHEAPLIMAIPLVLLAIMSVFFGYVTKDLFIGVGTNFWGNSLFVHPNHVSLIEAEFAIPTFYKLLPLFGSLFGGGLALVLYHLFPLFTIRLTENKLGRTLYRFLNQKYWFDNIYNNLILSKLLDFGYTTNKTLDRGVIELVGPYGLVNVLKNASSKITSLDTGFIPSYAMYIFSGLILFITLIFYVEDPRLFLLLLWAVLLLPSKKNA